MIWYSKLSVWAILSTSCESHTCSNLCSTPLCTAFSPPSSLRMAVVRASSCWKVIKAERSCVGVPWCMQYNRCAYTKMKGQRPRNGHEDTARAPACPEEDLLTPCSLTSRPWNRKNKSLLFYWSALLRGTLVKHILQKTKQDHHWSEMRTQLRELKKSSLGMSECRNKSVTLKGRGVFACLFLILKKFKGGDDI